jgi:hypothetical protein
MPQITFELSDTAYQWLAAEAASQRMSVEDVLRALVAEKSGTAPLNAHESLALRLIQNVSAKPGWPVPARAFWTNWQLRGSLAELTTALEGLARKGLISVNQEFTEVRLTEIGFTAGR